MHAIHECTEMTFCDSPPAMAGLHEKYKRGYGAARQKIALQKITSLILVIVA